MGFCSAKDLPRWVRTRKGNVKRSWVGWNQRRLVILGFEGGKEAPAKNTRGWGSWEFKEAHLPQQPRKELSPVDTWVFASWGHFAKGPWVTVITNAYCFKALEFKVICYSINQEETKILLRKVFPSILFRLYTTTTVPDKYAHRYTKLLGILKGIDYVGPALNIEPRTRDILKTL